MMYLFDIDGTLIGGDGSGRRAFDQACADALGIAGALDHIRLDGMTDRLILQSVLNHHHGREPTDAEMTEVFAVYVQHLEREIAAGLYHVKPAVHETLDLLESRQAIIGLATGNLEIGARIKLQRGDLWHRFGFGGYGSDAHERADLVRVAIARGHERAGGRKLAREEIFVIGDTPRDIAAAHAAGATAIGVATGMYDLATLE
ncbi:MAG TPA: HAD hydrolase-like protein, partial [Polyangia bacterium]|nr:HAD hydrolase-like protein [Polyangia bacterium]